MTANTRDLTESVWDAVAQVDLPEKKYFKIGEVAALVGVEPHVLRYWQTQFRQVRPQKSRSGHRQYRRRDVETLLAIKELLHVQRFTIAGARQALKVSPSGLPRPAAPVASSPVASAPVASAPVASAPVASPPVASAPVASAPVASPLSALASPAVALGASVSTSDAPAKSRSFAAVRPPNQVVVDVVAVETTELLQSHLEQEFARQVGAMAQVSVDIDPTPLAAAVASVDPELRNAVAVAVDGVAPNVVTADVAPPVGAAEPDAAPPASKPVPNGASEMSARADSSPAISEVVAAEDDPRTDSGGRARQRRTQQLGFGFVPTAREELLGAQREGHELLALLDREDALDRRTLPIGG